MPELERPLVVAPIGGMGAARLELLLRGWLASRVDLPEGERAYYAATLATLAQAARQWRAWRLATAELDAAAAADARAGVLATAADAGSSEIGTDAAAVALGLSPNRIRQLCRAGVLPARKLGRTWVVPAGEVVMRREVTDGQVR